MKFSLQQSIEILERSPYVLETMLKGLSTEWIKNNEGENTWSPYDIVGHLVFGEKTDWVLRVNIILSDVEDKLFEPFDRFAQLHEEVKPLDKLLNEFKLLRANNLKELSDLNIKSEDYTRTGVHPEFGTVTLEQLLSTWAVHDIGHIAQISRVMAKQYTNKVGPWIDYLSILKK